MVARLAVIGAGTIGAVHAHNIAQSAAAELVAVCDTDAEAAARLADPLGAHPVATVEEALALRPDAAIIASSTASQGAVAAACIAAGLPFLCEKPLASDLAAARDIAASAESAGLTAAMAFNRRFDAQYAAIREAVHRGEIGAPEALLITSRTAAPPSPAFIATSGGLFAEKGSHFYDLARWICGAHPVEVFAMGSVMIDPGFAEVGEVDTAMITLRMASGTLCQLDFSWRAAYGQDERLEVNGAEGMLQTRQAPAGPVLRQTAGGLAHAGKLPGWRERFAPTYRAELAAFIGVLQGGDAPDGLASLADGVAAQQIADAARLSARENRPVALADPV